MVVVDVLVYLQPCTSGDSYGQLENAGKEHREGNMDSKVPDDTHTNQKMDTFLEVEPSLHCMTVLEQEKEHAVHSMLSGQATSEG